jgi:hypothetical protein
MTLVAFIKSIARSAMEGVRRNKIPAVLSVVALAFTTALAFTSDFDERPHYRKFVLPEIQKAENQFFDMMSEAELTPDEPWRTRYFIDAHYRAKAALRAAQSAHPMTARGRRAQHELVRYYELVDEELAIIRTEMSFNESYDYISEWRRKNADLLTIRAGWATWLGTETQSHETTARTSVLR